MSAALNLHQTLVQQVDGIVSASLRRHANPALGPSLAHIEYTIDSDWSGDDAIHFLVLVHDPPTGTRVDIQALHAIAREIEHAVGAEGIPRIAYVTFRLVSEHAALTGNPGVTPPL